MTLWIAAPYPTVVALTTYLRLGRIGADAHAYWLTGQPGYHMYVLRPPVVDAFNYSPLFAQVVHPLTLLSWPAFCAAWMTLEALAFAWLLRPLGWRWGIPVLLLCGPELLIGNIVGFLAVTALLGMTRPAWWSVAGFTKPPMMLGPIWFLARGQWRALAWCVASCFVLAAISFASWPHAWLAWLGFLFTTGANGHGWLLASLAGAVLLTIYAARTNRTWLMAVALILATPVFSGASSLTILAAIPRLRSLATASRR